MIILKMKKYKHNDLLILFYKMIVNLISNNINLYNQISNQLSKYENSFEGSIKFVGNKK